MNNPSLKIFLYFLILLINTDRIYSCSCDVVKFEEAIKYADEIFTGKIVKVEKYKNGVYIDENNKEKINWNWKFHFEVNRKWKGNDKSILIIHHQGNSCDLYFDIYQEEYLVYATRGYGKEKPLGVSMNVNDRRNKLTTWLCSRTIWNKHWEKDNWFESDIIKLNEKFPNKIKTSHFSISWKYFFLLVILVIGSIFLIRKRKKPTANNV